MANFSFSDQMNIQQLKFPSLHRSLDVRSRKLKVEQAEKYILDLKPLEKKFEKNILDFEIKRKAIDSVKMYFNQKIWGFWSMLSQKKNSTENIEWSGLVNNDTAKLRNFFQIKVAGMSN